MRNEIVERWARVLVRYCLDLREGQRFVLQGDVAADPLLHAVYHEALLAGALVETRFNLPWAQLEFLRHASQAQIDASIALQLEQLRRIDALLTIQAVTNARALTSIDPARQVRVAAAGREVSALFMQRMVDLSLRWSVTVWPTDAGAQEAGMALDEYSTMIMRACLLDDADPAARWRELGAQQEHLVQWLSGKQQVHVTAPGTDLRFSIAGRIFINDDGRYNFPGGEVFTGPVEDSVEGEITFAGATQRDGRVVRDVHLRFEGGRVVEAHAAQGQDYLEQMLDLDQGARRVGEIAFGTNPGVSVATGNLLFDEKVGGTMHLALGASIPMTGGQNHSTLHWDLVCDLRQGGVVRVDDTVFASDGTVRIP